jgi:hypothetical protein
MTWLRPEPPARLRNASIEPAAGACVRLARRRGRFCLPSVVVIGAMRAGTSALAHALLQHPHLVRNADGKEVHYFSDPFEKKDALLANWPAYAARFAVSTARVRTLDKTAQYLTGQLGALVTLLPGARFVAVLREPGRRAYSEFRHHCRAGRVVEVVSTVGRHRTGAVLRGDVLRGGRFAAAAICYSARGRKKQLDVLYKSRENENPAWFFPRGTYRVLGRCATRHFDRFLAEAPPRGEWTELSAGRYAERLRPLGATVTLVDAADLRRDAGAVARGVLAALRLDMAAYPSSSEPYVPSHVDAPEPLLPATRARLDALYRTPNADLRRLYPTFQGKGWN